MSPLPKEFVLGALVFVFKLENSSTRIILSKKFSGGCVERATPVPIPNTEVKPLGADGTARATVWESRKPPGLFLDLRFEI